MAQAALRAPTVFNFYEPNYVLPGSIAEAGLYAPEYQILTDTTALTVDEKSPPGAFHVVLGNCRCSQVASPGVAAAPIPWFTCSIAKGGAMTRAPAARETTEASTSTSPQQSQARRRWTMEIDPGILGVIESPGMPA